MPGGMFMDIEKQNEESQEKVKKIEIAEDTLETGTIGSCKASNCDS